MIIAICGPSGSGKSVLLEALRGFEYFSGKDVTTKQEDDFFFLRQVKRTGAEQLVSEYKEVVFFKRSNRSIYHRIFSFFVRFIYPCVIYLEFIFDYFYYEILFKNKILLKDRYIYDYIVTLRDNLGINNSLISFFFERFPRPSLLFFLSINLNTAMKRNKNNLRGKITASKSFQKRVLERYSQLALRTNAIKINTNSIIQHAYGTIRRYVLMRDSLAKLNRIAIIGLDGTGKTTTARMLEDTARLLNIKPIVVHFYHNSLLFQFLAWVGYYKIKDQYMGYKDQKDLTEKSRSVSEATNKKGKTLFWAILHYSDGLLQYLLAIIFFKDRLLIFDRFFYDFLVNFEFLKVERRDIFSKCVPHVDKTFLLLSKPLISYKRKPENTLDFFTTSERLYKKLAKIYNISIIDTTHKTPHEVFAELMDKIVDH